MKILDRPFTREETFEAFEKQGFIEGIIRLNISRIFGKSFTEFTDMITEILSDQHTIGGVTYEIVGGKGREIWIKVVCDELDWEGELDDKDIISTFQNFGE